MAEFQKVAKEQKRMCKKYSTCAECPLGKINDGMLCGTWALDPEETEKTIMEWSAKNPPFTNAAKFKEVFGFDFQETFGCHYSEWLNAEYKEDGDGNG